MIFFIVFCSLFFAFNAVVFAQVVDSELPENNLNAVIVDETQLPINISPQADVAAQTATGGVGVFVRMVLILALIIAALYGIVHLLKRGMSPPANDNPFLRSVASVVLAPGRSVHVVTVGAQAFLVGVSENSVSLLGELTDKELIDAMNLHSDKAPQGKPRDFASLLGKFLPGSGQKTESDALFSSLEETEDFLRRRRQDLGDASRKGNSGEKLL